MSDFDDFERRLAAAKSAEEIAALEAEMNGDVSARWEVRTLGEVAALLGLQPQTVKEFRTLTPPMPGVEGHWNMIDIFRWRCERLAARNAGSQSVERTTLENRILSAKAERIELIAQSERGELVERSAAKTELGEILNFTRLQLEQIPSELGPSIPPDLRSELTHQLDQKIKVILRKISQQRASMSTESRK